MARVPGWYGPRAQVGGGGDMTTTLFEHVCAGAARVPADKPAVLSGHGALGYGDLLAGARGVAAALARAGVGPGDRVGLWMDKTPRAVQVLLGVLAAGAAYVPLDPRLPWRRAQALARGAGFAAVALDAAHLAHLPALVGPRAPRLVLTDADDPLQLDAALALAGDPPHVRLSTAVRLPPGSRAPPRGPAPDDLAYVLSTPDPTGTPWGVAHTHASGLAFVRWVQGRFAVNAEDVFLGHAPLHEPLAVSDLFAALGAGASVRLLTPVEGMVPSFLVRKAAEWGVTVWSSAPDVLVGMLERGELEERGLPSVRVLLLAGAPPPVPVLRRLRRAAPHARPFHLFGAAETHACTYWEVPRELPSGDAPFPLGRACEHLEAFVLDARGREAGEEGVLWVRGGGLAAGYLGDPDETARRLGPDPRGRPGRAWCTGERVRRLPGGPFARLGRADPQVETRGQRVDPAERPRTPGEEADRWTLSGEWEAKGEGGA